MIRFFKRYFGYPSFPAQSKSILKKALLAEFVYFGFMFYLMTRFNYIRVYTEKRGDGKITEFSGGNWEGFLEGQWYPDLVPLLHEMIFIWISMAVAIIGVGVYYVYLDWRTGSEAHHRVTLHIFMWLNFLYPALYIPTQNSRMAMVIPVAAMGLVLYLHMAKPTKSRGPKF